MSWLITPQFKTQLLLDQYPGAAAAYSLRNLTIQSNAPVVRVRRSSDNTESDFTATQISDGTLVTWVGAGNNGFVRTWYDQSGNSKHAIQATSTNQPRIVNNGALEFNISQPCINFSTSTGLRIEEGPLTGSTSPSVFILGFYSWTQYAEMLFTQSSGGGLLAQYEVRRGTTIPNSYEVIPGSPTALYGTASVVNQTAIISSVATSGARTDGYINSNLDASLVSSISPIASGSAFIGARRDSYSPFKGKLHEILVYSTDQSSTRSGIQSNINAHYSIY